MEQSQSRVEFLGLEPPVMVVRHRLLVVQQTQRMEPVARRQQLVALALVLGLVERSRRLAELVARLVPVVRRLSSAVPVEQRREQVARPV